MRVSSLNASGIAISIDALSEPDSLRAYSVMSCGVRMPATTSSPCALIRNSPYSLLSPVEGLRVNATPVAEVSPILPNTMACTLTAVTGVAFTRNPSTGESKLYGEFLINAQGEDVVAGIRTPQDITEEARQESGSDKPSMESAMPEAFKELTRFYTQLEKHYRDMQDMEFTVEQGKLWMLQTRSGKRTAKAALRIAVELANEGVISKKDAVMRIDPASLDQLLHPTIDPAA